MPSLTIHVTVLSDMHEHCTKCIEPCPFYEFINSLKCKRRFVANAGENMHKAFNSN